MAVTSFMDESERSPILNNCRLVANFTNILQAAFAPISFLQKNTNLAIGREKLLKMLLYEKAPHKMLVKLTPGHFERNFEKEGKLLLCIVAVVIVEKEKEAGLPFGL